MKKIKYILSSLMIMFLAGCYPGEDFGAEISMLINDLEGGLRSVDVTSSYQVLDGDPSITEVGVCWEEASREKLPTVQKNSKEAKSVTSPYSVYVSDLRESIEYILRPYMKVDGFIVYGNTKNFTTPSNSSFLPNLGELLLNKSELHKLVVSSSITSVPSEYPVAEVGVCYIKGNVTNFTKGTSGVKSIKSDLNDNKFIVEITDLDFSSSYSVRAYAINEVGIRYGDVKTFRTVGDEYVPKLGEVTITKNAPTYLEVSCTVSEPLKTDSIKAWFEYTKSYETTQSVEAKIAKGIMTAKIENLQPSYNYAIVAKAENKYGVGSSNKKQVTTDSGEKSKPILNAPSISDITVNGAHVESVIKIVNEEYKALSGGFEFSTSSYMNSSVTKIGTLENDTILKLDLSDLSENTTYFIQAYIDTELGKVYSNKVYFNTRVWGPIFDDVLVTDTTITSMNLSCNYKLPDQRHKITEAGFQYYMSNDSYYVHYGSLYPGTIDDKLIEVSLSNLKENSTYQIRTYMKLDNGKTYYGETVAVKTKSVSDYIGKVIISDILVSSANIKSTIEDLPSDFVITGAGFQYCASSDPFSVKYGSILPVSLNEDVIQFNLSSLAAGEIYQVRAYIEHSSNRYYGDVSSFTTLSKDVLPSIECDEITAVSTSSFSIKAYVKENNELYPITETGFLYLKSSYASDLTLDTNNAIRKPMTMKNGEIELSVYGLDRDATYLVRVYAISGSEVSYNSEAIKVYTNMDYYKPQMGTLSVEKTNGEYIASCKATVSQVFPITDSGFVYSTSTSSPTLASNDGVVSAQISESLISNKIAFKKPQTGTTTYYVRAYAKNANGVAYSSYRTVNVTWND